MTWTTQALDPATLQKQGWTVFSLHQLRQQYIAPARATGLQRTSLDNPAASMLRLLAANSRIAVLGAVTRTPADLRELYGYIVEPAYRAGTTLLVAADRELDDLDPADFIEPIGFAWSLERLQHLAALYRLAWASNGQPPMTPIEARLFTAMRDRGLAPIAQRGILRFRVDFAFPEVHLAVECDGRPYHDPAADARRDERLRREGWHVLHFTGSEIFRDAGACAEHVVAAVRQRQLEVPTKAPEFWVDQRSSWLTRIGTWLRRMLRRGTPSPLLAPATIAVDQPDEATSTAGRWTAGLDAEQQSSVGAHDGVVQVIAPAGSGKTTVLAARVRELLARGVPPNRILCLTFNTAAAAELNTRLQQLGIDSVEASTFHALGRRILKDSSLLRGDVRALSYGQWRRLAKMAMDQTEDGVFIDAPEAKEQISGLKLGRMMAVEEFAAVARTPEERTLAALYRLHRDEMAEQDRCDFDDFIFESLRLLQSDPNVRRKWQQRFVAVLVDEYQDIEPAQELLVQIVAAPEDMLFCVGDEDQCLYAWRRATVERVIELDQTYPGLQRHALARNYRCPALVVDASRALIGHNLRRFPKRIDGVRQEPGRITVAAAADMAAQAAHVARLVADLGPKQAVVLARTSRVLSEVALGLAQAGIRFYGPERLLRQRGEPAVLLAYMRLLGQPQLAREEDVEAVFRVPNRFLPNGAAPNVASGLRSGLDFQGAIARLGAREAWRAEKLAESAQLFDRLCRIIDSGELIHELRTDGGLDRHYASAERLNPTDVSDVDALERAQEQAVGMSVSEYANALDYEAHVIEQHFDKKGVELATIHGAKGREWPMVIVVGVQTDELPHRRSLLNAVDAQGELEAERRLAYVAMTRATQHLVLMHDRDAPSQFLVEAAPVAERTDLGDTARTPTAEARNLGQVPTAPAHEVRSALTYPSVGPALEADDDHSTVISQLAAPAREDDGSIVCSLPGCDGTVAQGFVIEDASGLIGICPRQEHHALLVSSTPALRGPWQILDRLDRESKRRWAVEQRLNNNSRELTDGAIRCALPGCGGIVKPDFVLTLDGSTSGLCPQRDFHDELVRADPSLTEQLIALERANAKYGPGGQRAEDLTAELLLQGGIPCSVPGCDGIVGPEFIVRSGDAVEGICGRDWFHRRLIGHDPAARAEWERLQRL